MTTTNERPLVSIIIPTYNNDVYLEKMIRCIIDQTYTNWELIVVDDISEDESVKMVNSYAKGDNRIKCIIRNREPKGSQTCRNIGFGNSKGDFVIFFDSDDLIAPYCLEQRVEFMQQNPAIDFGIFPAHSFRDENNYIELKEGDQRFGINQNTDVLKSFLEANYQFLVVTNIFRRDSIKNIVWDEKIRVLQDFDFNFSTLMANLRYAFCETARYDYFYRVNYSNNNVCATFVSHEKNQSTIYLFSKTLDMLKTRNDFKVRKKEFLHFIGLHLTRLIEDGDKSKIKDYLTFCEKYYSSNIVISLKGISQISLYNSNEKSRTKMAHRMLVLRFWLKERVNGILKKFK